MATKEDMVSAPLIALLLDRTCLAGSFRAALQRRGAYYGALALSWLLLAYLIASTGGNRGGSVGFNLKIQTYEYWLTQFPAVIYYLRAVFWPHPLIFEYGTFWISRPAWGLIGAFFFALLAPTSLAPGTTQMIVEHRMYLPLAAVLAGLGFGGARWARRPTLVVAGLFALVCLVLTWRRNDDYRDAIGLWQLTVQQRPDNVLAHTMLGQVLDEAGRPEEAKEHFDRALQLNPQFKLAQKGLQKVATELAPNGVVSGPRD
jgi:tetratricopeptide (TPR) repeat protein